MKSVFSSICADTRTTASALPGTTTLKTSYFTPFSFTRAADQPEDRNAFITGNPHHKSHLSVCGEDQGFSLRTKLLFARQLGAVGAAPNVAC